MTILEVKFKKRPDDALPMLIACHTAEEAAEQKRYVAKLSSVESVTQRDAVYADGEYSPHAIAVKDFMRRAGQDLPDRPTEPTPEVRLLRAKLILEEAIETVTKGLGVVVRYGSGYKLEDIDDLVLYADGKFDMVEFIDGCCDLKVVTTGALLSAGVADKEPQRLVDESNLRKFGPGGYRRDDGKYIKPPDWKAPDLAAEIERQRKLAEPDKQIFGYSTDEENYSCIFNSFDEAVQEGAAMADDEAPAGFHFWVGEYTVPQPEDFWRADDWLDHVSCQDEFCGHWADNWDRSTPEQHKELEAEVRAVMARWLDRNNLRPKFYNVNKPKELVVTGVTEGPVYAVEEVRRGNVSTKEQP